MRPKLDDLDNLIPAVCELAALPTDRAPRDRSIDKYWDDLIWAARTVQKNEGFFVQTFPAGKVGE